MKSIIIILCVCLSLNAYAQLDSTLAKYGKLDFAISEHPAFSILGNNSDNILRPSNTQELFSIIYANFLSGKSAVVPKDFSMEFSPVQLLGINKITFQDYRNNAKRILYDAKISVAAKTSNDGRNLQNFAVGTSVTWIDKSSLASNTQFVDEVCKGLKKDAVDENAYIRYLISERQLYNGKNFTEDDIAANNDLRDYIDSLYRNRTDNLNDTRFFSVKSLRQQYKKDNWNKFKFETAIAVRFSSNDSLVAHNHYSKFELYNTIALPLGKSGQWLTGLNFSDVRTDSIQITASEGTTVNGDTVSSHVFLSSLASRIYVGSNDFKTFFEGSGKIGSDKMLRLGLNIGAEFNILDGIWAMVNFGNNWSKSTDSSIRTRNWTNTWYWSFNLRFKLPETKRS